MSNPGSRDFERNERQEAVRNPGNTTDNAINLLSDQPMTLIYMLLINNIIISKRSLPPGGGGGFVGNRVAVRPPTSAGRSFSQAGAVARTVKI